MAMSFLGTYGIPIIEEYIHFWKEENRKFWNFGVWTGMIGEALKWRALVPLD